MLYLVKIEIAEDGGKKTVWIKPFKCFFFIFLVIVIFVYEKAETSPIYVIVLPQQNIFFSGYSILCKISYTKITFAVLQRR